MKSIIENLKSEKINKYRALPFWSWNDKLEPEELVRQIKWMKENGFGGYFMHARGGLMTEYLGDEWFDCVSACLDAGSEYGLESWGYDENGWPSGFVGGKLLEDKENCDRFLTFTQGEYDGTALVSYLIDGENLVRTKEGGKGEYINVYEHISDSTADILNPEVVDKFIDQTHAEYKRRLGDKFDKKMSGFFTDEPQYYRWQQPYTKMIEKYFREVYSQDILDGLGLLYIDKKGYREFRYKFWLGMQTLMLNGFCKRVYEWCDNNNAQLTGHYVEEGSLQFQMCCCGGIMPMYEYMHIPGMDKLGASVNNATAPKQVSSVARQLGKDRVLTETFACCGWGVSAKHAKRLAEWQFVNGVNLICQHLLPYSEHGQRKRDYPAHYSWANPWVRDNYKPFNDYFAKLGYLLGESKENVNVAVFVPIRSMYFDYTRATFGGQFEINDCYQRLIEKLSAMNIPFHLADETIMEKYASVSGNKLVIGNCSYDYLVFPKTHTMGKFSKDLFEKFYSNGGKVLFTDAKPNFVEWNECDYSLETNTSFEEILNAQEYIIDDFSTQIQSTLREIDGKKFIYTVNLSEDKEYTVTLKGDFKGFTALDLETYQTKQVGNTLRFSEGQSYVLFLNDQSKPLDEKLPTLVLDGDFEIVDCSDNYLTLDKLEYSFDGVNYSKRMRYMGVFNQLLDARYSGEVYLRYSFEIEKVPQKIHFLSEDMHNLSCQVNGVNVEFNERSDFERKIYKADISNCVKKGINQAVIKINFFESEEVYDVLFGGRETESLKNKLAYDTTIESCYIQGDFGVYSKSGFVKGVKPNVLKASDFYISERKTVITDTVKDGYPFFAGNITFEKKFNSDGKKAMLLLNGKFCLAEIFVNGKKVEKSYFEDRADISDYLVKGENVVRIKLWSGNRNLLGPHHYLPDEDPFVGPYTYELGGTWKDGVSSHEREDYAFIRFGLFND